jgi:hypothetical protein
MNRPKRHVSDTLRTAGFRRFRTWGGKIRTPVTKRAPAGLGGGLVEIRFGLKS